MKICGLNKTTLLDYPGKVAATVFLGGCNFRCPFCHNSSLVLSPFSIPELSKEEFFSFLKKRKNILQGVCVTGGEPTLFPELPAFLREIRSYGLAVKLDTNGSRPDVLKALHQEGLLDTVAMDIKASRAHYGRVCGIRTFDVGPIEESVQYLMHSGLEYEFRTTVVRELHTEEDFREIGQWLAGARAYYLQAYRDSPEVIQPGFSSYSLEELEHFRSLLLGTIDRVEIRGMD